MPHAAVFIDQLSTTDSSACCVERRIKIDQTIALSFVTTLLPYIITTLATYEYCHLSITLSHVTNTT
jgi:hypothetical protein